MADSIPASRVLCLCTYRPGYVHPFGDRTYHTRIALPTLSDIDTVQVARAMLATDHLPERSSLIVQKAEGNRSLSRRWSSPCARLAPFGVKVSGMSGQKLSDISVPNTIQDVLMARIDRLPEAPKTTRNWRRSLAGSSPVACWTGWQTCGTARRRTARAQSHRADL